MEIEELIGMLLKKRGLTIAAAESCTGGLISSRITNISGASEYFVAGLVTYSNKAKTLFLSVPEEVITQHGAVSSETAQLMAEGVRNKTGADIGIAVTGIAGPLGGTPEKPVGTVFIGISAKEITKVRNFSFTGSRLEIKQKTSDKALEFLKSYLEDRQL